MATKLDLERFISSRRAVLTSLTQQWNASSDRAQLGVDMAQCRDAIERAEIKLNRMHANPLCYAMDDRGFFFRLEGEGVEWKEGKDEGSILPQEEFEMVLTHIYDSDWKNTITLKELADEGVSMATKLDLEKLIIAKRSEIKFLDEKINKRIRNYGFQVNCEIARARALYELENAERKLENLEERT